MNQTKNTAGCLAVGENKSDTHAHTLSLHKQHNNKHTGRPVSLSAARWLSHKVDSKLLFIATNTWLLVVSVAHTILYT